MTATATNAAMLPATRRRTERTAATIGNPKRTKGALMRPAIAIEPNARVARLRTTAVAKTSGAIAIKSLCPFATYWSIKPGLSAKTLRMREGAPSARSPASTELVSAGAAHENRSMTPHPTPTAVRPGFCR